MFFGVTWPIYRLKRQHECVLWQVMASLAPVMASRAWWDRRLHTDAGMVSGRRIWTVAHLPWSRDTLSHKRSLSRLPRIRSPCLIGTPCSSTVVGLQISVSFLAEITVGSPHNLLFFIVKNFIFWIRVSKKHICFIYKTEALLQTVN